MNSMENTRLYNLTKDFLDDKLDAAGQREFYALLGDPREREALTEILMELTGAPDMNLEFDPSLQPLLDNVTSVDLPRKTPVRRMRYWSWAAAIALLVLAGSIYWFTAQRGNTAPALAQHKAVPPGKQGAVLMLADGSSVQLDSMKNGVVANQAGTNVVLNNGQVVYNPEENSAAATAYNTISTPRGRQFSVVLPDGTKVWLNAASSLRYPVAFPANAREVRITGEAYFEVAADATRPFSVRFNEKGIVEVLGTAFNLNAYTDEPQVKTTLLSGSIRLNKQQVLRPGEQANIDNNNSITVNSNAETENAIAWKKGLFMMSSTDLPALFRQISRWYDIEVDMKGELPKRSFGGTIARNVNLTDIIEALNIYGVNCKLENNKLVVQP